MLETILDPHYQRPFHGWRLYSLCFGQICFAAVDDEKNQQHSLKVAAWTPSNANPPDTTKSGGNTRMQLGRDAL
eukprot:scaffold107138_cov38-Cyclotella_meneghiniana.AAC.6